MKPKVIRTGKDHEAALARINALMAAEPGTPEGEELDLWATLVDLYEREHFPIDLPDQISAIRFRMEQAGLRQADLIPYIGSRAKVSEVLSGKRGLSLRMIRSLSAGLGIPTEVLVGWNREAPELADTGIEWDRFPVVEMAKRGWFPGFSGTGRDARDRADELVMSLRRRLGSIEPQPSLPRQHIRAGFSPDQYALLAWQLRVLSLASEQTLPEYRPATMSMEFVREMVRLSYFESGPLLAKELLAKAGIPLVTERHLPGTHLDGAALTLRGRPVVALTLRYDRLDNFWFTLCHELAHVALHQKDPAEGDFLDNLDVEVEDAREKEADEWAAEALLPSDQWEGSPARSSDDPAEITQFAAILRISPAIVAGRIRKEREDYRILNSLVGHRAVRRVLEGPR